MPEMQFANDIESYDKLSYKELREAARDMDFEPLRHAIVDRLSEHPIVFAPNNYYALLIDYNNLIAFGFR